MKKSFGFVGEQEVFAYTIENAFLKATILSMGGTLQSLVVKEKGVDVVLGYDTPMEYLEKGGTIGAICGRFANRIRAGKLTVDGVEYALYCNDRGNHLHGGKVGYNKRIFGVEEHTADRLVLTLFSPDGEENYPGNLRLKVVYSLEGSALKISYEAVADKATAINLTNHAYFNLNGAGTGSAYQHTLQIAAPYYLSTDENMIPDGKLSKVENTPFDFRNAKTVASGDAFLSQNADLKKGKGFDHCFVFEKERDLALPIATLCGDKSGITMLCYTTLPAVQLYAGNFLNMEGKAGFYGRGNGLCLETQAFPDNVNVPAYAEYGSSIYAAGQRYESQTIYEFIATK
ncbi:MAG: galactose mutarotase [Clostridia bacterium]|nr:galactose mutarotase [Clostridia bacterium]